MLNTVLIPFRTIFLVLGGYEQVVLENLALREQLGIFQRSVPRPTIRRQDRLFWVWLQRVWKQWRSALVIVQPETVLDWQRRRFKRQWRQLSRRQNYGRPRTGADVGKLVKMMAETNVGWGAPRIHGELLKL
jgi:putative transposase